MRFGVLSALLVTAFGAVGEAAAADRIVESLWDAADDAASGLQSCMKTLSFDMIDFDLNPRKQTAHVRIGKGDVALDSEVVVRDGAARVAPWLAIAGVRIKLPEFDLVPRSLAGCRYLEIRVPLFEGHF